MVTSRPRTGNDSSEQLTSYRLPSTDIAVALNPQVKKFHELKTILKQLPKVNFILENLGKSDFTDGAPFKNGQAAMGPVALC